MFITIRCTYKCKEKNVLVKEAGRDKEERLDLSMECESDETMEET
jgi:hypothetical protein